MTTYTVDSELRIRDGLCRPGKPETTMRRALSAIVLGMISCIPIPGEHEVVVRPAVHGRLTTAGLPIGDAEIRYSSAPEGSPCAAPEERTVTDIDGSFAFEGAIDSKRFLLVGLIHCHFGWSLCIQTPTGDEREWRGFGYGPCSAPSELMLDCELMRQNPEPLPGISTPYANEPTCRYRNLLAHELDLGSNEGPRTASAPQDPE